MEVEGSTAVDVQDASFLKKDAIVIEDASDAVESSKVSAEEAVEKEADCSSVVVGSISNLENVEKDDLLQRIEEVCNDKRASVERSEGISNASEHEFLKKAEMKNLNLRTAIDLVDDEADAISDECKDNISSQGPEYDGFSDNGSSSNGDAVVINDKVIVVKDDTSEDSRPISLSSSDDAVEAVSETSQNVTIKKSANKIDDGALNKDSAVTSSTTKSDDNIICIDDTEETLIELPESSTGNQKIKISEKEEEKVVPINIESSANDGEMEVDNIDEVVSESMDMDAKASSPSNNNMDTGNEATSKSNEKISDGDDIEMIDLEAVPSTEGIQQPSAEIDQSTQSIEKKGDGAVLDEKSVLPAPSVVNHNIKDKPEANEAKEATKSENKPLVDLKLKDNVVSSSLSNTPVSSSNVCKTTPIPKKFEQSEIVNKISDAREVGKDLEATSSKQVDKTSGDPTTKSEICATSETDAPSSDGTLNTYIDVMKKYNGIADTTTDEEDVATPVKRVVIPENKSEGNKTQMSETHLAKDSIYEVRLCSEKNDVRYLSIERIEGPNKRENSNADKTATSDNSVQSSSNGSVSNLPVFPLPQSHGAQSSASSSSLHGHTSSATQNKHTIHGIEELCTFMINQFTKIKQAVNPDFKTEVVPSTPTPTSYKSSSTTTTPQSAVQTPSKSAQQNKRNKKNNSPASETPSASASAPKSGRSRKRSFHPDDSDSATPKTKQVKRDLNKESPKVDEATTTNDDGNPGSCVLAKWVDKKFYAGRITGEKPGNKYSVLFEDGASKILPKESIVFGEGDILPLLDHQVYAFVEDGYECGTVCSIEKSNKVLYEVKTESATVKVTASEIYLEGHQAKEIQKLQNVKTSESVEEEEISGTRPSRNKRPHASPNTTEAGCSSAAGKRGKRQKSYSAPIKRDISPESSYSSDTPPPSPKEPTGLELVEGVQPELQTTPNESELSRMIFISDYKTCQPDCDVDEMLGPMPKLTTLFRNKYFLLTCTVGLKPHQYQQDQCDNMHNNRFKQFSRIPFIKSHLRRQLEAGGATVYNYFEDVPKNKYKQCKLIAPRPCLTAKYVQCLAADIQALLHDWVIESCRQNKLVDLKQYQLPAGWSILTESFVDWKNTKDVYTRFSPHPFTKTFVLIAGEHNDFIELWGRTCKLAGAKLRLIKSSDDITPTTIGYMVAESDLDHEVRAKAHFFGIPVVSTVWIVQSLIMGEICLPNSHPKLTQLFEDDEI